MELFDTNGQASITLTSQNASSGRGGIIELKSDSNINTLNVIGDVGTGFGSFHLKRGSILLGEFSGSSSGSLLQTYDEAGTITATLGSFPGSGGYGQLYNSLGAPTLYLAGDSNGSGLLEVRNASSISTVILDGDNSGRGRITAQEYQVASSTTNIASGATLNPVTRYVRLASTGGAITLNAGTAISSGSGAGVIMILEGTSDANSVTIPDNANTRLGGSRILGANDTLTLLWNGADWIELSFANN
jgi:hypothetical protein